MFLLVIVGLIHMMLLVKVCKNNLIVYLETIRSPLVFLGTKPTATSIGWGDPRALKVHFFLFC
jgi:hypothetical protein